MSTIPKELQPAAKHARKAGWTVEPTRGGHLAWVPPEGQTVYSPSTPSCSRSVANVLAKLRRAGLRLDRPPS
jgi:predicted RNA binding protein YcfA (HicA-like mRNA interferase family)